MTEVCIAGRGLAALTCALLVARQGRAVRIYGAEPTGARPLVLPQATVELLVDVWGADAGLLAAGWPVQRRWVRWGTAAPEQVSVRGVTLDGTELNQRLAAHLSGNHAAQIRFENGVSSSDGPVATEGNWLVTAVPPDAARFVTAGRRRMITTEAPLAPTADPHTCSMATGRQAWAFLTPIGSRRALVQAMVPGPVHDPVRFLGRLLHETGLGAQLAGSPATATVVPAAPQLLAPPCEPGWFAVGSAAVQFDPLSGSGAAQAVRTAILAAAAIERGDSAQRVREHYAARLRVAYTDHLRRCLSLYRSAFPGAPWQDELDATALTLRATAALTPRMDFVLAGLRLEPRRPVARPVRAPAQRNHFQ